MCWNLEVSSTSFAFVLYGNMFLLLFGKLLSVRGKGRMGNTSNTKGYILPLLNLFRSLYSVQLMSLL